MRVDGLYNLRELMRENGMMFCYAGPLSQGVLVEIGEILRKKLEMDESGITVTQKVFAIFVEQVQNIMNYSAERTFDKGIKQKLPNGVIVIGKQDKDYFTVCGNLIEKREEKGLQEKLNALAGMSKEELKSAYKQILRNGKLEEGKGAGLGFIEMARKSSRPIEYVFKDIDKEHSYFSYKVVI